ncbi:uncharacterized protein LOC132754866 [Ruditapes philippinarum]|uniref:uncharacterized protein LOC132754866 n=1 Tax=Ruditapes philippinarum TaxID=129788 RepID=UPI00295C2DE3|nr:uncharacterized protein LOC132754866 [Ruditapes philippinarum]
MTDTSTSQTDISSSSTESSSMGSSTPMTDTSTSQTDISSSSTESSANGSSTPMTDTSTKSTDITSHSPGSSLIQSSTTVSGPVTTETTTSSTSVTHFPTMKPDLDKAVYIFTFELTIDGNFIDDLKDDDNFITSLNGTEMVGEVCIISSMMSAGINDGLASPPHAADEQPADLERRNLGQFLYVCYLSS